MSRHCRLELNNSGSWKLLGTFDASRTDAADRIMNAAAELAAALNERDSGRAALCRLRVSTDDALPVALMYWTDAAGGWKEVPARA